MIVIITFWILIVEQNMEEETFQKLMCWFCPWLYYRNLWLVWETSVLWQKTFFNITSATARNRKHTCNWYHSSRSLGKRIKISKKDVMNETKGSIETWRKWHKCCVLAMVLWLWFLICIQIYIQVTVPNYVSVYNKQMGAVDMLDSNVGVYRIDVRGKK